MGQLSFADVELGGSRKPSRITVKLDKIDNIVDWNNILSVVKTVDRTGKQGGAPHRDLLVKVKMLFLQHLYNLSDPELEDQVNDRLSFQRFAGIGYTSTVPDYTTIWRFKDALIREGALDALFESILSSIEARGLVLKKGTSVDATLIPSGNRPLSNDRREELDKKPSSQIDTDATSTQKRGKWCFGHKGHIGIDLGSKIIRKRAFTTAKVHDSKKTDDLLSGDERAVYGDSAYGSDQRKREARKQGIHYGIIDKAKRGSKLSVPQKKRNKLKSKVRNQVEHPFAYIKSKLGYTKAVAKTLARNSLRFDFNCMLYNIFRADYLLSRR